MYNAENTIEGAVNSLLAQDIDADELEVVLIDDGSTDATLDVCRRNYGNNSRIVLVEQENLGVSAARNAGIRIASGRYLAFLDSDDELAPNTLKMAVSFFDKHFDEIDIVVYPRILRKNGKEQRHISSRVLERTGIYDLEDPRNAFALVTMLNVLVKNDNDLPFFDEGLFMHEDEQFLIRIILKKSRLGYIAEGAYYYNYRPDSAVQTKMHPFYQFEENVGFWEDLFSLYPDKVPRYLQASYLNEVGWKLRDDQLFPYHYDSEDFARACERMSNLLARVGLDVLEGAPNMDIYHRIYLLKLSGEAELTYSVGPTGATVFCGGNVIDHRSTIEMYYLKTRVKRNEWSALGFLKAPVFSLMEEAPRLYLVRIEEDGNKRELCPIARSSWGYHRSKVETNTFWGFDISLIFNERVDFTFEVELGGRVFPVSYFFDDRSGLSSINGRYKMGVKDIAISSDSRRVISIKRDEKLAKAYMADSDEIARKGNRKAYVVRRAMRLLPRQKKPVWLYYDRGAVGADNAYYQFIHDLKIQDGVARFYVTSAPKSEWKNLFPEVGGRDILKFDSALHKILHLRAELLLVAYIEKENWLPFSSKGYPFFSDLIDYSIVHLQHGVLHAHQPWKHSYDRLLVDGEVVSTGYELENFVNNYGFPRSALIPSGMPRYDFIDVNEKPSRKILFAPSWRKYMVRQTKKLDFLPLRDVFLGSKWWKETLAFFNHEELKSLLEGMDMQIDIKLHPILGNFCDLFEFDSDRINVVDRVNESDYEIVITDYSSWVFDFVYLNRKVLYFVPDYDYFRSGLNSYRELDIPLEHGFGPLSLTSCDLLDNLKKTLRGEDGSGAPFRSTENFFLFYDSKQRDRLYEEIVGRISAGLL